MSSSAVKGSITIAASAEKVWDALINPAKVLQYLGATVKSDWQTGSPIVWESKIHGTAFVNKGNVLIYQPYSLLKYTYWSGMGGDADAPENYSEITFELTALKEDTLLNYTRINIPTIMEQQIFESHLGSMLEAIKSTIEVS